MHHRTPAPSNYAADVSAVPSAADVQYVTWASLPRATRDAILGEHACRRDASIRTIAERMMRALKDDAASGDAPRSSTNAQPRG